MQAGINKRNDDIKKFPLHQEEDQEAQAAFDKHKSKLSKVLGIEKHKVLFVFNMFKYYCDVAKRTSG
jgi:hypothetical protein